MIETRDWGRYKDRWARLLEERTALDVDHWNRRIRRAHLNDEESLRAWLTKEDVINTRPLKAFKAGLRRNR